MGALITPKDLILVHMSAEKATPIHICTFDELIPTQWNHRSLSAPIVALQQLFLWAASFPTDIPDLATICQELQVNNHGATSNVYY